MVVSGSPGAPEGLPPGGAAPASGSRPGPTLADQLTPGQEGVVWHATSGNAALELVTGRGGAAATAGRSGTPLTVVDRVNLARGPGGRSVIVELDPARLQGTPGPERQHLARDTSEEKLENLMAELSYLPADIREILRPALAADLGVELPDREPGRG